MVGWCDEHHCVRVLRQQAQSGQPDARRRVPAAGFDQDMARGNVRKLTPGFDGVSGAGDDPRSLIRRQRSASPDRLLNQ